MKIPFLRKKFPEPGDAIDALKRYLHLFALLQKEGDSGRVHLPGPVDMLCLDKDSGPCGSSRDEAEYLLKKIMDTRARHLFLRKSGPSGKTDLDIIKNIAHVYSSFVIETPSHDLVLNKFIEKHPDDGLWILARIHFAILEKRIITFDYLTSVNKIINNRVHPYHIVFRNNNLYLLCKSAVRGRVAPFILSGIRNLNMTDQFYDDDIPPVDFILNDTLSSYTGGKYRVTIRFSSTLMPEIEQMLSILEPVAFTTGSSSPDMYEASFNISDDIYLCRQLFQFGSRVEILEPPSLREMMIGMLKQSLSTYQ